MITVHTGDCREILPTLESGSVQCCVTSPPYWGLRDYGTGTWEGGDADCDHIKKNPESDKASSTLGHDRCGLNQDNSAYTQGKAFKKICGRCGAIRIDNQIGLEETPEEYVNELVKVFREVRRILKDDGTCWVNLGDTYQSNGATNQVPQTKSHKGYGLNGPNRKLQKGLKPKDLVGIPWMVAFALRSDGWYLRQDIIWHKPNPMPESVTDRCTKAHEYLFLLSKSPRYYFDNEAIAEPVEVGYNGSSFDTGKTLAHHNNLRQTKKSGNKLRKSAEDRDYPEGTGQNVCGSVPWEGITRNKRSVWSVCPAPYSDAHFATYPPKLIQPCILASSKPGDTILDPFGGSGTTGKVAIENGRKVELIELNPDYGEMIEKRTTTTIGLGI